jgi:hypothetical protein
VSLNGGGGLEDGLLTVGNDRGDSGDRRRQLALKWGEQMRLYKNAQNVAKK